MGNKKTFDQWFEIERKNKENGAKEISHEVYLQLKSLQIYTSYLVNMGLVVAIIGASYGIVSKSASHNSIANTVITIGLVVAIMSFITYFVAKRKIKE